MGIEICPSDMPVLLLYNLDPKWSTREQAEALGATSQLGEALCSAGFPITLVQVANGDLAGVLSGYDPLEYIVFNWCDSLPGVHHSESLVAMYLEQHGFTFTGAGSAALASSYDKCHVKRLLDEAGIPTPTWNYTIRVAPLTGNVFPPSSNPPESTAAKGFTVTPW